MFIALVHNIDGQGTTSTVAVKKLKKRSSDEEMEEFFNEIKTMKRVGYHPNIISLMGCCTIRQPLLMIMEYIGNGDLQHYLRAIRAKAGYTQTFEDNRQNALVQSSTDEENDFCSGTEDSDRWEFQLTHNFTKTGLNILLIYPSVIRTALTFCNAKSFDHQWLKVSSMHACVTIDVQCDNWEPFSK